MSDDSSKFHHKRIQALVRYMRAQKVQSFTVEGLTVQFSPEALLDEVEVQPSNVRPLARYADDDERLEAMQDARR